MKKHEEIEKGGHREARERLVKERGIHRIVT